MQGPSAQKVSEGIGPWVQLARLVFMHTFARIDSIMKAKQLIINARIEGFLHDPIPVHGFFCSSNAVCLLDQGTMEKRSLML